MLDQGEPKLVQRKYIPGIRELIIELPTKEDLINEGFVARKFVEIHSGVLDEVKTA